MKRVACLWCENNICRSGNEETCDFKSLPMEADAIKKRIASEFEKVFDDMIRIKETKEIEDYSAFNSLILGVRDKVEGMKIMRQVLLAKFGVNYFPVSLFKFAKLIIDADKQMRRLKDMERQKQLNK